MLLLLLLLLILIIIIIILITGTGRSRCNTPKRIDQHFQHFYQATARNSPSAYLICLIRVVSTSRMCISSKSMIYELITTVTGGTSSVDMDKYLMSTNLDLVRVPLQYLVSSDLLILKCRKCLAT